MPLSRPLPARFALLLLLSSPLLRAQTAPVEPPRITLKAAADYLALHLTGTIPPGAAGSEYRLTLASDTQPGPWLPFPQPPTSEGAFAFSLPLREWRWARVEVRTTLEFRPLSAQAQPPRSHEYRMLTAENLAALPEAQRSAWEAYLRTSEQQAALERDTLAAECRRLSRPSPAAAPGDRTEFEGQGSHPPDWYRSPEASRLIDSVLSYQPPSGGWAKAIDYATGPRPPGTQWTNHPENPWHYCGTLDNHSTTEQIRFLAAACRATQRDDARTGALRGIEWLLTAQYPHGGWPQNYPVEPGYHEAITLNDGAMLHAMELLLALSRGDAPFDFTAPDLRQRARTAFDRALACVLSLQVKVDGRLTVWCAQHHPLTLAPVAARLKEPPSLSGAESADFLRFLMRSAPLTPELIQCVESALSWLDSHRITGLRLVKTADGQTDYLPDPASTEVYWARFYDVQTAAPLFAGAQDGIIYPTFHAMAQHNKVAYNYFTTRPADLLTKEIDRWKKRLAKEKQ